MKDLYLRLKEWVYHVLIALDQLFNALLMGSADETLSSRVHRNNLNAFDTSLFNRVRWKLLKCLINLIFFWEKDHCRSSFLAELNKKHWRK